MAWNRSQENVNAPKKSPPKVGRGLVAGLIVVAAVAGALVYLMSGEEKPQPKKTDGKPARIKEVTPAAKTTPKPVARPVATSNDNVRLGKDGKPLQKVGNKWGTMLSATTNQDGNISEQWVLEDGTTLKNIRFPPPIFDNAADQILGLIASVAPGADMPPLPAMGVEMDKAFAAAIATPIHINETDSDEVKDLKSRVMETRRQMAELMGEGKTFSQIVAEHQDLMQFNSAERTKAIREIQNYLAEGDEESARLYRDKINAAFETMGIDAINMAIGEQEKAERETKKRGRQ